MACRPISFVQLLEVLWHVAHAQLGLPDAICVSAGRRHVVLLLGPFGGGGRAFRVGTVGVRAGRVQDVRHHLDHRGVRRHPQNLKQRKSIMSFSSGTEFRATHFFGKHVPQPQRIALRIGFLTGRHGADDEIDDLSHVGRLVEADHAEAMVGQMHVQRLNVRLG